MVVWIGYFKSFKNLRCVSRSLSRAATVSKTRCFFRMRSLTTTSVAPTSTWSEKHFRIKNELLKKKQTNFHPHPFCTTAFAPNGKADAEHECVWSGGDQVEPPKATPDLVELGEKGKMHIQLAIAVFIRKKQKLTYISSDSDSQPYKTLITCFQQKFWLYFSIINGGGG